MMTFSPIMFARHSLAQHAENNAFEFNTEMAVMDFSGTEALLFLTSILGLDISKLTASGLGVKGSLDGDIDSDFAYSVYFFSETAFRFILPAQASKQLQSLINEQQLRFDIDYVMRSDLNVMTLCGEQAFDAIVDAFKLTPGLRLSNSLSCYGAQSGAVFVTAVTTQLKQYFQLVAKNPELEKWQAYLQQQGFDTSLVDVT